MTPPTDPVTAEYPRIYCPIPSAVHPEARRIEQRTVDWMRKRKFYSNESTRRKLEQANVGGLVARLFPYGTTAALEAISRLHCWGFAFDDEIEQVATHQLITVADQHFGLVRMLDAPSSDAMDGPHASAFQEICQTFRNLATPAVFGRWADLYRGFTLGAVWASIYRQAGAVPSMNTLTTIRQLDSGALAYGIGLIELAGGFELTSAQLARPAVRTLTDITAAILAWDNDIYSYRTEVQNSIDHINLVTAISSHEACSPQQALTKALHMRNQAMRQYLHHRGALAAEDNLSHYLRGLDHQLRGNLDWGLASRRYDTANRHQLSTTLDTIDEVGAKSITPPCLPTIQWWWGAEKRTPRLHPSNEPTLD
ncbi:hypothetical protein [Nocardia sp. BMG51109]|uniref:terpene synthase family protein n=1 Tax=Nocardia sp. BMG51109 TaxID=1056816 RepID=UPI0004BBA07E|nr:hypothetical protein [Nocardia sp. BMG51109]